MRLKGEHIAVYIPNIRHDIVVLIGNVRTNYSHYRFVRQTHKVARKWNLQWSNVSPSLGYLFCCKENYGETNARLVEVAMCFSLLIRCFEFDLDNGKNFWQETKSSFWDLYGLSQIGRVAKNRVWCLEIENYGEGILSHFDLLVNGY